MSEDSQNFYNIPILKPELRKLLIYSKITTLVILDIYGENGYPRAYLVNDLGLPEGALNPNIKYLKKHDYIKSEKAIVEGKESEVYKITDNGHEAIMEILGWIEELKKYKEGGKNGNQGGGGDK
jgi:DNA-binding MarR family transcriptional regulator